MTDETDEAFEHRVQLAVMAKVRWYCNGILRERPTAAADGPPGEVYVLVVSARDVREQIRKVLRDDVKRLVKQRINAELQSIRYAPDAPDDAQIHVHVGDRPYRGVWSTRSGLPPDFVTRPGRIDPNSGATLTLHYDSLLIHQCPLRPLDGWRRFGRELPPPRQREATPVRIRSDARIVPRGSLIYLRFWDRYLDLVRSGDRFEYIVVVDGAELSRSTPIRCRFDGTIEYRSRGGSRTVLSYQLRPEIR